MHGRRQVALSGQAGDVRREAELAEGGDVVLDRQTPVPSRRSARRRPTSAAASCARRCASATVSNHALAIVEFSLDVESAADWLAIACSPGSGPSAESPREYFRTVGDNPWFNCRTGRHRRGDVAVGRGRAGEPARGRAGPGRAPSSTSCSPEVSSRTSRRGSRRRPSRGSGPALWTQSDSSSTRASRAGTRASCCRASLQRERDVGEPPGRNPQQASSSAGAGCGWPSRASRSGVGPEGDHRQVVASEFGGEGADGGRRGASPARRASSRTRRPAARPSGGCVPARGR